MEDGGATPACLQDAYRFLNLDRAWVACIPCEGCAMASDAHVHTVASKGTCRELEATPGVWQFLDPRCPKAERIAFLMGGVDTLVAETMAEPDSARWH